MIQEFESIEKLKNCDTDSVLLCDTLKKYECIETLSTLTFFGQCIYEVFRTCPEYSEKFSFNVTGIKVLQWRPSHRNYYKGGRANEREFLLIFFNEVWN